MKSESDFSLAMASQPFDQDLCTSLWYELNPRVRCAFGNVFKENSLGYKHFLQINKIGWICFIFREDIYHKQIDSDKVGTCTSSVAASKHKY